jgi:hypothetical protein
MLLATLAGNTPPAGGDTSRPKTHSESDDADEARERKGSPSPSGVAGATSEAVKTRFGRNSEFFFQTKWVFTQNYELQSSYLLENVVNTCKSSNFCSVGHNDFVSKSCT